VRCSPVDHVKLGPAVLGLSTRGRSHEEVVLELPLEVVLFDVVGKGGGDHPIKLLGLGADPEPFESYLGYPTPVKPLHPTM